MDQISGKIGFDRSRVRILLCDKDPETAQEVKELLCRCSYHVSVVKTARQVVEVLNIVDSKVDLVLAEVELPNGRGFKMLKHIVKTDTFKHIPIVMMSARDEMAVVVKCLRLGAADYLVKPLRVNELLNLWTHMWRRRRMLGLTEKQIINGHLTSRNIIAEIFVSDTSESNTMSTDILSEDSNDAFFKAKESNLRSISEEPQAEALPELELSLSAAPQEKPQQEEEAIERKLSPPRKCELKLGQSSAFLSYTKSISRMQSSVENPEDPPGLQNLNDAPPHSQPSSSPSEPDEEPGERACNDSGAQPGESGQFHPPEAQWRGARAGPMMQLSDPRALNPVFNPMTQPRLISPLMLAHALHPSTILPPAIHYYQAENVRALHSASAAFSYYPYPIHVSPQQVGPWTQAATATGALASPMVPPMVSPMVSPAAASERKSGASERREAALNKFRQKRKDRCFEKKIRYASRKRLAEQRPRIKGQFVRRTEDDEEDDDDDETGRELSPESGVEVDAVKSTVNHV